MRNGYQYQESKLTLQGNVREIYEVALAVCFSLYEENHNSEYLNRAFDIAEKSKATVLSGAISSHQALQFSSIPGKVLKTETELREVVNDLEGNLLNLSSQGESVDSAQLAELKMALITKKQSYDSLLTVMETDYPDYFQMKYEAKSASPGLVMEKLKKDEALISYYWAADIGEIYTFVITSENFQFLRSPMEADFIYSLADFYRFASKEEGADMKKFLQISNQLYAVLIEPVEELIRGKDLIISPDGLLATIPFEILVKKDEDKKDSYMGALNYLIRNHEIHYTYSATIFSNPLRKHGGNGKVLAFAPSFNQQQLTSMPQTLPEPVTRREDTIRGNLSELKGSVIEIERLKEFFSVYSLSGEMANEAVFKSNAIDYGILHLATHAIIDGKNPLNSYLIFTSTGDSTEDNNLYAWELYNMRLNAQMAVLSACNTGFGKLQRGEGVMSLGRAFAYAGVPSIVMSLWPAEDESTADLMGYFYEALAEGQSKDEALRNAKLRFLKEMPPSKHHPFYWAGFVVQGDAGPLEKQGFPIWGWGLIGLIFISFGWWIVKNKG
ncbi:MAG: CHAT domain-containing protein [Bacteroidia bacterium]